MKKEMIELSMIDELLEDYKQMKNKGESFSDFIRCSKEIFDDDKPAVFDYVLVEQKDIEYVFDDDYGDYWYDTMNDYDEENEVFV